MQKEITIPENVDVIKEGNEIIVKGIKGELRRTFIHSRVKINIEDNIVKTVSDIDRRKINAIVSTWNAHLKNMFIGSSKGWETKLKVIYSHFPLKIEIKDKNIIIHNFQGEKKPRVSRIHGNVKVEAKKDEIIINGINKEDVSQTAAEMEKTTKIRGYDRRVFQDGIYLLYKTRPFELETKG